MKTIIGIFIVVLSFINVSSAQSNFITKHMKEYMNSDDFTTINLSLSGSLAKEILNDIGKDLGTAKKELAHFAKNLSQMNLLMTEKKSQDLYKNALSILKKEKYKPMMVVKEGKEAGINIMTRESSKGIEEVLFLIGGDEEFVVLCLSGKK